MLFDHYCLKHVVPCPLSRLLNSIFIVMMDQACEYGDFLDWTLSKERLLNQQLLTRHEQMLI